MNDAPLIESTPTSPPGPRPAARRTSVRTLALLDTSAASTNLGDHIIMEAVRTHLLPLFTDAFVFNVTSHDWMGAHGRGLVRNSDWAVSGGTSLLSSRMWYRPSWKVSPLDALAGLEVVLMGAGWHQYQRYTDPYSKWLLRSVLSRRHLHSVRDGYTLSMLRSIGIDNAVNTACPTLWTLTPEHCRRIPREKARAVVTTVNSYRGLQAVAEDRQMLAILTERYQDVYVWIQTHTDFAYARSLNDKLRYIDPSIAALDAMLTSDADLDYVGIRLHAGIRALQRGRRTIIVAIDNRAREMSRDFGLPTVGRNELADLARIVEAPQLTQIRLPVADIERWKRQFEQPAPSGN